MAVQRSPQRLANMKTEAALRTTGKDRKRLQKALPRLTRAASSLDPHEAKKRNKRHQARRVQTQQSPGPRLQLHVKC